MAEKLNTDGFALREVIAAELERQHENTGIYGLVVRRTDEPGVLILDGQVDLDALTIAIMKHGVGTAYKAVVGYNPFEDDPSQTLQEVTELLAGVIAEAQAADAQAAEPERVYLYDCDHGQGEVVATNLELAKQRAQREAGSLAGVRNVRQATPEDLAVRKAMGGSHGA
ncbi:hypothetical protein RCRUDOLPH_79 [Rhodobacter phage RcRudolph]|nr:hypothetical protein RCRUDOLPH_79 [Rhodobacter phage RcRudolph]